MNFEDVSESIMIINTTAVEIDNNKVLEVLMEIDYKPYIAYCVNVENKVSYYAHFDHSDEVDYICPFCQNHSTEEEYCAVLSCSKPAEEKVYEKVFEQQEKADQSGFYQTLTKREFQEGIQPRHIVYSKSKNMFYFTFILEHAEDDYLAPYTLADVSYLRRGNEFVFHLENSYFVHSEAEGVPFDGKLSYEFTCDCGYEYDHERFIKNLPNTICPSLDSDDFKVWAMESFSEFSGFGTVLMQAFRHPIDAPIKEVKNKIVDINDYRKNKNNN